MLSNVEVSRFELLMICDLIQVVGVVSDVALLLENAASILHQIVSLVNLLLALLCILTQVHAALLNGDLLLLIQRIIVIDDALRVCQPRVSTGLTKNARVASLARADLCALVPCAKSVALALV